MLAQFVRALQNVHTPYTEQIFCTLGTVVMLLPVWNQYAGVWKLSAYKEFTQQAIGIAKPDMRVICNYLHISQPQLIDVLYRMSMLAVCPGTSHMDKPRYRMPFTGTYGGESPFVASVSQGFVIEQRRAMGTFK